MNKMIKKLTNWDYQAIELIIHKKGMIMLNQVFIGTVLTAITAGAVAAYRHHQWRKYHIIDNHKEIDKKYAGSDILSISAKQATSIGGDAFRSCSSLEKANFPKLVSIILLVLAFV